MKNKVVVSILCCLYLSLLVAFTTSAAGQLNLLANSGFENGLTAWSFTPGTAAYSIDSAGHTGACVRGVETSSNNLGRLYQDVTSSAVPGNSYRISGWIKTSNVTGAVVIGLDYVAAAGFTPAGGYVSEIGYVNGTQDWVYFESPSFVLPVMPSGAVALYFLFDFNQGTGTAWWDDVALTAISNSGIQPSPQANAPAASWPMFGHDLSGVRFSSSNAPRTSQILWSSTLDSQIRTSVTILGSYAYVGSFSGNIYSLNAATGAKVWNFQTTGPVWSSPTIANGMVYVGSNDWKVYALDANNGGQKWVFPTGGGVFSSPVIVGNTVYVGSTDSNMYALDAGTGAKIWNYTTGGNIRCTAAVVNGVVFFGSQDGNFYALDAASGAKIWSSHTGDGDTFTNSSPAVANSVVYVGSTDFNLYAFRTSDGSQVWNYRTGGKVSSSPAIFNGAAYVGSEDGSIYAVNLVSGTKIWSQPTDGPVYSSPAVANGIVFAGSWTGTVYAFDTSTGAQVWSYGTGGGIFSSPTIAGGVMFVGSYDSKVYAFGSSFTPGVTSPPAASSNPNSDVTKTAWVPPPANGAAAAFVTVGAVGLGAALLSIVASTPVSTASGILGKIASKIKELMPETVKKWLEDVIASRRKLKVNEKTGSPYLPTKPEILVYGISIIISTLSFAYVKVENLSQFWIVLPTFFATSILVSLARTYILSAYTRRKGVWTEYKLWYFGVAMFLVSTLAFRSPFSSPTRTVHHSHNFTERLGSLISCAAVLITLGFGALFLILLKSGFTLIGGTGLAMCIISAFFETFPIEPMSGKDIYKYSKPIWAGMFFATLALYAAWLMHIF